MNVGKKKYSFYAVYIFLTAFNYCFMHLASLLLPGVAMSHEQTT